MTEKRTNDPQCLSPANCGLAGCLYPEHCNPRAQREALSSDECCPKCGARDPGECPCSPDEQREAKKAELGISEPPPSERLCPNPECRTPLLDCPGIGLYCPNKTCDVADGPDIWPNKGPQIVSRPSNPKLDAADRLYRRLMDRIQFLMEGDPPLNTPSGDELSRLADWAQEYEKAVYSLEPYPANAIVYEGDPVIAPSV